MKTNEVPHYDDSVNPTGCCPKFNPEGWDGQVLHFRDKKFVRAETRAAMHIPLNIGRVFERVGKHMEDAGAIDIDNSIILSKDISPWRSVHYFSTETDVPEEDMVKLSGDYLTKVFEGPYRDAKKWVEDLDTLARDKGHDPKDAFFFFTTCPKCAKVYGKNYVVGVVQF